MSESSSPYAEFSFSYSPSSPSFTSSSSPSSSSSSSSSSLYSVSSWKPIFLCYYSYNLFYLKNRIFLKSSSVSILSIVIGISFPSSISSAPSISSLTFSYPKIMFSSIASVLSNLPLNYLSNRLGFICLYKLIRAFADLDTFLFLYL